MEVETVLLCLHAYAMWVVSFSAIMPLYTGSLLMTEYYFVVVPENIDCPFQNLFKWLRRNYYRQILNIVFDVTIFTIFVNMLEYSRQSERQCRPNLAAYTKQTRVFIQTYLY